MLAAEMTVWTMKEVVPPAENLTKRAAQESTASRVAKSQRLRMGRSVAWM